MSEKIEFTPPKGFHAPENVEPDKDFDLVCSFRAKEGGKLCMTKLGDTDCPGYGDKKEEGGEERQEHKPDYSGYAQELSTSMGEGGAPNPNSYNG
jgi:hypothetical protein